LKKSDYVTQLLIRPLSVVVRVNVDDSNKTQPKESIMRLPYRREVLMLSLLVFLVPSTSFATAGGNRIANSPRIAGSASAIGTVSLQRETFNPTAGDTVDLSVTFRMAGNASVRVVDRDGFVVRTIAAMRPVQGSCSFHWDGRDDGGRTVADEAYAFRIEWVNAKSRELWFPADRPSMPVSISPRYFDRRSGTLAYTLPHASRVHIQAGTAVFDAQGKAIDGPVLKTIVNREPRSGGTVAEHWNGFDDRGGVFVADLEGFAVSIAAAPLAEGTVIAYGNHQRTFVAEAAKRRGASLFSHRHAASEHHAGLATLDDVSPSLRVEPLNATWSAPERVWVVRGDTVRLRLSLSGPTAAAFARQPSRIHRFINGRRVGETVPVGKIVEVPLQHDESVQRVSINWRSEWGPLATDTIRARRAEVVTAAARGAR
jgi:FlgD Ig-like domain